MNPELESSLLARVLAHIAAGTTDLGPAEERVPVAPYLEPAQLTLERERLFARHPLVLAPAAALRRPGDFVSCDGAGLPILLVRDQQCVLRAFVNACRHRGTRLALAGQGHDRNGFTCPYHAWTYGSDGRLLRVSHEGGFCNLRKEDLGLVPLPVWERAGLVWVLPQPHGELALIPDDFLAAVEPELRALGLDTLVQFEPPQVQLRSANWKLLVEGGLEAYHFRFAHAKSIAATFFDNLLVIDALGAHQRLVLPRRSIRESASESASASASKPAAAAADGAPRPGRLRAHSHLVYHLFPSTMLLVQPDHVTLVQFEPVSVAQTRILTTLLIPPAPASAKADAYFRKHRQLTLAVLEEDYLLAERIQDGLQGGGLSHVVFGRNEPGPATFRRTLAAALDSSAAGGNG